jgi:hypothetical protein
MAQQQFLYVVVAPVFLALLVSGGIAYGVVSSGLPPSAFFTKEQKIAVAQKQIELRSRIDALSEQQYSEFNSLMERIKNSQSNKIPRARMLYDRWGPAATSGYAEVQRLKKIDVSTVFPPELDTTLRLTNELRVNAENILGEYNTIPSSELNLLIDFQNPNTDASVVPQTNQSLRIISASHPYVTVQATDMPPHTVFTVYKQGGDPNAQYQMLPVQKFDYGGSASVSIAVTAGTPNGWYIVRAANNEWHIDSAPFILQH